MRIKENIRPYQIRGVKLILENESKALLVDMGLGKTMMVLAAFRSMQLKKVVRNMLVVAPLQPMYNVWRQEAELWDFTRPLTFSILHGPRKAIRAKADVDVFLVNYSGLRWLSGYLRELAAHKQPFPFDMLVLDESTFIKSSKSQRFRKMKGVFPFFKRRYILTGTPSSNGLMDLWAQFYALDQGKTLGKTITEFRTKYFFQPRPNNPWLWVTRPGADKEIAAKIAKKSLVLKLDDYLKLPPVVFNRVEFELTPKLKDKYAQLQEEMWMEIDKDKKMFVFNAQTLTMKLRQFTAGIIYDGDKGHSIHKLKADGLKDLLTGLNSPAIVAIQFKKIAKLLHRTITPSRTLFGETPKKERSGIVTGWNAGEIQTLIAHPATMAHGLNLQAGGNNIVFYSLPWSLEQYHQLIARLHRSGQKKPVVVNHLIIPGTIDEVIYKTLQKKDATQKDLIKNILETRGKI